MIAPTAVQAANVSPVFHARGLSKTYRMGVSTMALESYGNLI
jgi:hypothetical protein